MFYLDTSLLVPLFVPEPHSDRAAAFVEAKQINELALSDWTTTEMAAALSAKVRTGSLPADALGEAIADYHSLRVSGLVQFQLTPVVFTRAAALAADPHAALRAGDALHLAIAVEHRVSLVTLDKRLARAAEQLAHPVLLL